MADNVIGIQFGVAGGSSISGESGKRIKAELEALSKQIQLQVNIDQNHFAQQLTTLKAELEKKLGEIKITINTQETTATQGKGKTSSGGKNSSTKVQASAYADLRRQLEALAIAQQRQVKLGKEEGVSATIAAAKVDELTAAYAGSRKEALANAQITRDEADALDEYAQSLSKAIDSEQKRSSAKSEMSYSKLARNAQGLYTDGGGAKTLARDKALAAEVDDFNARVKALDPSDTEGIKALNKEFIDLQGKLKASQKETDTLGNKLKDTFTSKLLQTVAYAAISAMQQALQQLYQNVVELDGAVTDLQIASGKTREETEALVRTYSDLAKQLGATTLEVAESANTWLRQGYTVEETSKLIEQSMMLSKLGMMESADAATALTSAIKGYKMEVADASSIVDKFTAVDMEAAVSAGDIATAMAETSASAEVAGVSMDKLIGYITTVAEVTQDGAESVGTFYKTLFARMGNVSAGNFVDEETGESLNDVEKTLNKLGISLRNEQGEFRDFGTVLDEVGEKWDTYDNVTQHALATAFAGTRQQEKFIVLMENYASAMDYAAVATNSSGTAQEKYTEAYMQGIEASLNKLTASWESLSQNLLDSDLVKFFVDLVGGIVDALDTVISFGDGTIVTFSLAVAAAIVTISLLKKALKSLGVESNLANVSWKSLVAGIQTGATNIGTALLSLAKNPAVYIGVLIAAFAGLSEKMPGISTIVCAAVLGIGIAVTIACAQANNAVWSFMASNPIGWILAAVTALVLLIMSLIKWITKLCNADAEARKAALATAEALQEEADALREVAEAAEDASDSVQDLIDEFKELEEEADNATWYEYLKNIGESAAGLFPDRELTALQAINELLKTTYTYDELINLSNSERLDILNKINDATLEATQNTQREAYNAQKEASDSLARALSMSINIDKKNEAWNGASGSTIKNAVKKAEELAKGIEGVTIRADGKTAKIIVDSENIGDYVDNLQAIVDAYDEEYKYNSYALNDNAIYQYLTSSLAEAQESLRLQTESALSLLQTTVSKGGLKLSINMDSENLQTEYDNAIKQISNYVKQDSTIADAMAEGIIDESHIGEFATEYIAQYYSELYNAVNNSVKAIEVAAKTMSDMLGETEDQFDLLSTAMNEMSEAGALSADTIRSIIDEFPELLEYLEETEDGFALLENALPDFLTGVRNSYLSDVVDTQAYFNELYAAYESAEEKTIDDYNALIHAQEQLYNAIGNAEKWERVEAVLMRDGLIEQYTELLEKQTDDLDEQYDAYKDLCDIRKDLLKTYEEELKYKNELAKKQKKVADLQTELSLAQLDNSAAGRARVRELQEELKEAQEELDEYTLEHAIDDITKEIEASDDEYKKFIEGQIETIETAIENATTLTTSALSDAISNLGEIPVDNGSDADSEQNYKDAVSGATADVDKPISQPTKAPESDTDDEEPDPVVAPKYTGALNAEDYSVSGVNAVSAGLDDVKVTIGGKTYKLGANDYEDGTVSSAKKRKLNDLFGGSTPKKGTLAALDGVLYMVGGDGHWVDFGDKGSLADATSAFLRQLNSTSTYHTGGFVGDLRSNEEFAKLMKGEFVVTPSQMRKFMDETVPKLSTAGMSTQGGVNYNAPLIAIQCDSVSEESMPVLKKVINEAVQKMKDEIDSVFSRTGYKKGINRFSV